MQDLNRSVAIKGENSVAKVFLASLLVYAWCIAELVWMKEGG